MKSIKILLSIGVLIFGIQIVNGQGWERSYGDSLFESAGAIVQTIDGGFVVTGTKGEGNYLLKIDSLGIVLWEKDFGGNKIQTTQDNGLIIYGSTKVTKTDIDGNIEWEIESEINDEYGEFIMSYNSVEQTVDGGYILTGAIFRDDPFGWGESNDVFLLKIDAAGGIEWQKDYQGNADGLMAAEDVGRLVRTSSDGGYIIITRTYYYEPVSYEGSVINPILSHSRVKTDSLGNIESTGDIWGGESDIIQTSDGSFACTGTVDIYHPASPFPVIIDTDVRFRKDGINPAINQRYGSSEIYESGVSLVETPDGGFAITGYEDTPNPNFGTRIFLIKTDIDGNLLWKNTYQYDQGSSISSDIINTKDKGFIIAGTSGNRTYLIKTDSLGNSLSNQIQGNIWQDAEEDCIQIAEETRLKNWIVQAKKEDRIFYGTTDSLGYYDMTVDTGDYVVNVIQPNTYWEACDDSIIFSFTELFDTTQIDFPMLAVFDCPILEVDISSPFLRRCFESNYYIQYCNKGTFLAEDAYVTIAFDEYLIVNSSSIPSLNDGNNIYTFDIGDVAIGDCGTFQVNITVDCDSTLLGQTHCVEANIFPDSLCLPPDLSWDQANIEVNAECLGDSIQFIIQNTGVGNMGQSNDYVIIIDDLVLRSDDYQINSGIMESFKEAADGETFRLQTMQTDGHPIGNMPSITIEGCGTEDSDSIHIGFVTQFPEDDDGPFVSIDCQENIGSYDPNDKQAYPKGVGEEHFIEQNIDIEYKIRFQNTGTDTAFTVVVLDTIAEFLEPTSIIPGASSHPYKFELYGYGVVKFTFDNILLVDSTTNEAGSHGFIKFRIAQKENNPLGTLIQNSASIYFDYNAPIKTNTTFHTVGEDFLDIISSTSEKSFENTKLSVYPNPVENIVTFHLEGIENEEHLELNLYDMTGRLIRKENYNNSIFDFSRGRLPGGMYFYSITTEKGEVNSGKLIVK